MINATEIRKGMILNYDGVLHLVVDFDHITPGNWRAIIQVKTKNLQTGSIVEQRMRSSDKVEPAVLDEKVMEYLYKDSNGYVFMDTHSYEQYTVAADVLGNDAKYLTSNLPVAICYHEGRIVSVQLPNSVELTVVSTSPNIKSATATNVYKPAETENGLIIQVPPFIQNGEKVKIDTRTGQYLERAK
ncbi:MAG: elongation factor P [Planctomycetes bacterium]|nr:elongation factor P [Planctomycetota bacterium]